MTKPQPNVVAIGGGHGLSMVLAALRPWTDHLTAVVSVADDGGSSGRLRAELGLPAPGDVRRCIEALAPDGLAREALGHRFAQGELSGHAMGNVLLAGLLEVSGDPVAAIDTMASMVGVVGRVLPATSEAVDLVATVAEAAEAAEAADGVARHEVIGQEAISACSGVEAVRTEPAAPAVPTAVLTGIARADLVVLGPGSLFTSVLAAVAPAAVGEALAGTGAPVVMVANLASQERESAGMTLGDHVAALVRHGVRPDVVLVDEAHPEIGTLEMVDGGAEMVVAAAIAGDRIGRHEPSALGAALIDLVPRVVA